MRINRACPICKKPAEYMSEFMIGGLKNVLLKCGHMTIEKKLKSSDFEDFVSSDGKRPRQYQIDGALFALNSNGRFLIADEMGLGKTIQLLMFVKAAKVKPIILCKSGLRIQWMKEMMRWCGDEWLPQIIESERDFLFKKAKAYIISFDILWRFKDLEGWINRLKADYGVDTMLIDECQHIKNSGSKRTQAVITVAKNLQYVGAASGTPIKNHAAEYFPVLHIVAPDRFRTASAFEATWVDSYFDGYKLKYGGLKHPERFKEYTKDIIIRRTREEVAPELPAITRDYRYSELGDQVEQLYKDTFKQFQDYYNYGGAEDSAFVRSSNILSYLTKMRHITGVAKIDPCVEFVTDFIEETDRKIVIFVHHKDVGSAIKQRLEAELAQSKNGWGKGILEITSDMNAQQRDLAVTNFWSADYRVMVASTLASGEGLNLQCCSDCVVLERQWNPANEEQAEGRFIRLGQTATKVTGTYMVAVGTVDEFFAELVEKKRGYVANTLDGKEYAWEESSLIKELAEILAQNGGKKWGW